MSELEESRTRPRALRVSQQHLEPLAGLASKLTPGHDEILGVLNTAREQGSDSGVSLADYWRLLKALALAAGEETFQLSTRPLVTGTAEFILSKAEQASTIAEAMREIAQGYNLLHGDTYNRIDIRGGSIIYVLDDESFPYTCPRNDFLHFTLECTLIFIHAALCELAGEDLTGQVRRILTRRAEGASAGGGEALAFWDAPVRHGENVYSIAYDAAVGGRPVRRRRRHMPLNLAVHNRLLDLIQDRQNATRHADGVEAAVLRALRDGLNEQAEVAARLGLSVASLRRKLSLSGARFRTLHQAVLKEKACTQMVEHGDVAKAAETLGFSDPRSFTRAFKALTGQTPSAYAARTRSL